MTEVLPNFEKMLDNLRGTLYIMLVINSIDLEDDIIYAHDLRSNRSENSG